MSRRAADIPHCKSRHLSRKLGYPFSCYLLHVSRPRKMPGAIALRRASSEPNKHGPNKVLPLAATALPPPAAASSPPALRPRRENKKGYICFSLPAPVLFETWRARIREPLTMWRSSVLLFNLLAWEAFPNRRYWET